MQIHSQKSSENALKNLHNNKKTKEKGKSVGKERELQHSFCCVFIKFYFHIYF